MDELWFWVVGFEGRYRVSSQGNVFSVRAGRNLRPGRKQSGHLNVMLGRLCNRDVHVLVAESFLGARPLGCVVRHLDGDPSNNKISNLEWSTYSVNAQDKKHHERPSGYKLRVGDIRAIRKLRREGCTLKHIANLYGLKSLTSVSNVCKRKYHLDVD